MKKIFLLCLLLTLPLFSKKISIEEILKNNFQKDIIVEKKSLILTSEDAKKIQKSAMCKLNSKIVRLYSVKQGENIIGYGVLLRRRIRTKNAAVLYMIGSDKHIKAIEILSFSEPLEYKPNQSWQDVFVNKSSEDMLIAGKDIPTISGATMSARALSEAAKLAIAIIEQKYK